MEVTLTNAQEAFIQEEVSSGRYLDASDVVRHAMRSFVMLTGLPSPELEAELLEGIESAHHPLTEDTLEEIRQASRQLRT